MDGASSNVIPEVPRTNLTSGNVVDGACGGAIGCGESVAECGGGEIDMIGGDDHGNLFIVSGGEVFVVEGGDSEGVVGGAANVSGKGEKEKGTMYGGGVIGSYDNTNRGAADISGGDAEHNVIGEVEGEQGVIGGVGGAGPNVIGDESVSGGGGASVNVSPIPLIPRRRLREILDHAQG